MNQNADEPKWNRFTDRRYDKKTLSQHGVSYHCPGYVIGKELCAYFLFDIFRLIGMEIAQSNGIFQFPE